MQNKERQFKGLYAGRTAFPKGIKWKKKITGKLQLCIIAEKSGC